MKEENKGCVIIFKVIFALIAAILGLTKLEFLIILIVIGLVLYFLYDFFSERIKDIYLKFLNE